MMRDRSIREVPEPMAPNWEKIAECLSNQSDQCLASASQTGNNDTVLLGAIAAMLATAIREGIKP